MKSLIILAYKASLRLQQARRHHVYFVWSSAVPSDNVENLLLQNMSHAAENLRSTVFVRRMGGSCYFESRTLRVGAVAMCQKMSIEIQANLPSGAAATSWHSTDGDSERYCAIMRSSGGASHSL